MFFHRTRKSPRVCRLQKTAWSRGLNIPSLEKSGHPQTICVDKDSCGPPRAAVKTTRTSDGTQRIKTGVGCPLSWAQSSSGMMWQTHLCGPCPRAANSLNSLVSESHQESTFWTKVLSCLVELCECWLSLKRQSFIYAIMNLPEWTLVSCPGLYNSPTPPPDLLFETAHEGHLKRNFQVPKHWQCIRVLSVTNSVKTHFDLV